MSEQFLIAAAGILCCATVLLVTWNDLQISGSALRSSAESSSVFMELVLEPNVQELAGSDSFSQAAIQRLDDVLRSTPLGERLLSIKVWRADGTVVYSPDRDLIGRTLVAPDVSRAASGTVVAEYDQLDESGGARERQMGVPILEVYAPLRETGTNRVIAVGEYYENAQWLHDQLAQSRGLAWLVVGATMTATLGGLFLIVKSGNVTIARQRRELGQRMAQAERMARQNVELRIAADQARLDASEANEQLLAEIGSELHDGPIQLLSVVSLKLSGLRRAMSRRKLGQDPALDTVRMEEVIKDVTRDLRNLSVGLILPEIEDISLKAALELAISRHREATGTDARSQIFEDDVEVSLAVKTCAYRVIQEGLNNAYKHGDSSTVSVTASVNGELLKIVVADEGPGIGVPKGDGGRPHLGLTSLRNRLAALKGSLQIESGPDRGTIITAALPLDQTTAGRWTSAH